MKDFQSCDTLGRTRDTPPDTAALVLRRDARTNQATKREGTAVAAMVAVTVVAVMVVVTVVVVATVEESEEVMDVDSGPDAFDSSTISKRFRLEWHQSKQLCSNARHATRDLVFAASNAPRPNSQIGTEPGHFQKSVFRARHSRRLSNMGAMVETVETVECAVGAMVEMEVPEGAMVASTVEVEPRRSPSAFRCTAPYEYSPCIPRSRTHRVLVVVRVVEREEPEVVGVLAVNTAVTREKVVEKMEVVETMGAEEMSVVERTEVVVERTEAVILEVEMEGLVVQVEVRIDTNVD